MDGNPFDRMADGLHCVAATAMGFAFAAGVVLSAIHQVRHGRPKVRVLTSPLSRRQY